VLGVERADGGEGLVAVTHEVAVNATSASNSASLTESPWS